MYHFGYHLVLLSTFIFTTCHITLAQSDHDIEFILTGTNSTSTTLFQYYGDYLFAVDTLDIKDEKVELQGDTLLTEGLYRLYFPSEDNFFEFIVSRDQHFRMRTLFPDLIKEMIIIGSEENQVFYKDLAFIQEKRSHIQHLRNMLAEKRGNEATLDSIKVIQSMISEDIVANRESLIDGYPNLFYTELLSMLNRKNYYPVSRSLPEETDSFSVSQHSNFFLSTIDFSNRRILNAPVIVTLIEDYLQIPIKKPMSILHQSLDVLLSKTLANKEVFRYCTFFLLNRFSTDSTKDTYQYIWDAYVKNKAKIWKGLIEVESLASGYTIKDSRETPKEEALSNGTFNPILDAANIQDKAPEIVLEDEDHHFVSLYLSESPYTLLVFGNHLQPEFEASYHSLQTFLKDSLQNSQLLLFYVDLGESSEHWDRWMNNQHKIGIHVHNHKGRSGIEKKYDLRALPRFFLLDEEKRILFHTFSLGDICKLLTETLDNRP